MFECLDNSVDWLQVMDLVVNGLYKSNTRRMRLANLHKYMSAFQIAYFKAKRRGDSKLPFWSPPKPTIINGLLNSMKALKGMDINPKFRDGMMKAFESVGLAPISGSVLVDDAKGVMFRRWTGTDKNAHINARGCGLLTKLLAHQDEKQITIGDLADDSNLICMSSIDRDAEDDDEKDGSEDEAECSEREE